MPIILTAIVETLLYLLSIPLCAAFTLTTAGGVRCGVGVSAFEPRQALRRARAYRPVKRRRKRGARPAWPLVRQLRGARIRLRGRLGLGDAAATALACGALRGLAAALGSHAGRVEVDVTPVFAGEVCLELTGMIRLRTGQIMTAIIKNQIDNIHRRIARWTSIPLKA